MANISLTAKGKDQELILAYLQENASEVLTDKINNGTPYEKDGKQLINRKDLNGFMSFACDEARKLTEKGAKSACVEDSVVYGWAIHYFEEDSIVGKLFNQDGTEYKPPAPVKKTTTKPTPTPTPPPKPKSQFSFFDMLDEKKDEVKLQADDHEVVDDVTQQDEPTVEQIADNLQRAVEQKQTKPTPPPQSVKQEQPKPKNELYEKYLTYINRHPDSVIAMRVGDFYEVLGKRAVSLAEEIGLTLTSRDLGLPQRVPMIGFPYHAADIYFKKMRQRHSIVVVDNDGERKLPVFGLEDVIDSDDELTEDEMRQFDGDIQEPKELSSATTNEVQDTDTDSPYDEAALAKVVKLLGNNFILR